MSIVALLSDGEILAIGTFEQVALFHAFFAMHCVVMITQIDRLDGAKVAQFAKKSLRSRMSHGVFGQAVAVSGPENFKNISFLAAVFDNHK